MRANKSKQARVFNGHKLVLIGWALLTSSLVQAGGSWSSVNQYAPDQVWLMLLLPDGTILCENNPEGSTGSNIGGNWLRLTPDNHGSYANGNWSWFQHANDSRQFFSSQVLTNGKVFVAGGEYGSGTADAELFDPQANSWTYINPPASLLNPSQFTPEIGTNNYQGFVDSESEILPNGTVLISPVFPASVNQKLIYNPNQNSWSSAAASLQAQGEATWVKLRDGSILTVDSGNGWTGTTSSERYIPSLSQWYPDAKTPVNLWANMAPNFVGETGPAFLLPNGKAFFLGGSGHTAIYTPSSLGGTNQGSWQAGPDIPGGLVCADAAGCMMVNGKILFDAAGAPSGSGGGNFPNGLTFFEYDYAAGPVGTITPVASPPESGNFATYQTIMLAMPDGTVLYSQVEQGQAFADDETTLYIYTPDNSPLSSLAPVIKRITLNPDGSYHLVGTGLNGITEGASYGDDAQMNSNYPLVRLTDGSGNVTYARTYNWSSTGVQTGTNLLSVDFTVPSAGGQYSLVVTASGLASAPVTFLGAVWVDFNYSTNSPQLGTFAQPFSTLAQGTNAVASGGTISLKPGHSSETMKIAKAMKIIAFGGIATIGR